MQCAASSRGTIWEEFMSRVFVVDPQLRPLHPCTPARARLLLKQQKAAVLRRFPFTLILRTVSPQAPVSPFRLKLDPGSRTTGVAVVNDATGEVVWVAELVHRGEQVREMLTQRRAARRSRRARHTRYRQPRFANRRDNVLTWVERLRKWCPITALSMELVKFDTQLLQQSGLAGDAYLFGTLAGFELREYVLTKWNHTCAYCGARDVPLELDHVVPKSRGGSHRESNRVPACHAYNLRKGQQPVEVFLSLRWALYEQLQATGLPVEIGSGGRTKWNRTMRGLPKAHWIDASAVGSSTPAVLHVERVMPWRITATGRQRGQMCLMDAYGFPRTRAKSSSCVQGFRTGDMVRAVVTKGKQTGVYSGRVAVRTSGFFNITTKKGAVQGVAARYCTPIQRADGYSYQRGGRCFLPNS